MMNVVFCDVQVSSFFSACGFLRLKSFYWLNVSEFSILIENYVFVSILCGMCAELCRHTANVGFGMHAGSIWISKSIKIHGFLNTFDDLGIDVENIGRCCGNSSQFAMLSKLPGLTLADHCSKTVP